MFTSLTLPIWVSQIKRIILNILFNLLYGRFFLKRQEKFWHILDFYQVTINKQDDCDIYFKIWKCIFYIICFWMVCLWGLVRLTSCFRLFPLFGQQTYLLVISRTYRLQELLLVFTWNFRTITIFLLFRFLVDGRKKQVSCICLSNHSPHWFSACVPTLMFEAWLCEATSLRTVHSLLWQDLISRDEICWTVLLIA